jgi:hypothetical protein
VHRPVGCCADHVDHDRAGSSAGAFGATSPDDRRDDDRRRDDHGVAGPVHDVRHDDHDGCGDHDDHDDGGDHDDRRTAAADPVDGVHR